MGGIDLADQMMSYYVILRQNRKWWKMLFIHLINQVLFNTYRLYEKYGENVCSSFIIHHSSSIIHHPSSSSSWWVCSIPPLCRKKKQMFSICTFLQVSMNIIIITSGVLFSWIIKLSFWLDKIRLVLSSFPIQTLFLKRGSAVYHIWACCGSVWQEK